MHKLSLLSTLVSRLPCSSIISINFTSRALKNSVISSAQPEEHLLESIVVVEIVVVGGSVTSAVVVGAVVSGGSVASGGQLTGN
jgi:hypothetical protein